MGTMTVAKQVLRKALVLMPVLVISCGIPSSPSSSIHTCTALWPVKPAPRVHDDTITLDTAATSSLLALK